MSDYRRIRCVGTKRRPHKPDIPCSKEYLWIAKGSSRGNFGRNGAQACPNCGTLPDFSYPLNRFYSGSITYEEAVALMPEWLEQRKIKSK